MQEGVGALVRQAGLELMQLIMEDEVRQLAGERCQRRQDEQGYRWGREDGLVIVDGQKVKVQRPRVRSIDGPKQPLGSDELFRCGQPLDETVGDKLMLEISTRNYAKAGRQFVESYGIEKSAVSKHFESAFSVVDTPCRRVKCWKRGNHVERWVGSAMGGGG